MKSKQWLQLHQLDDKLLVYNTLKNLSAPTDGWLRQIRKSLGMTLEQLGNKLGITKQSARAIEQREKEGTLTIQGLKQAASAMDMQLVYVLLPKDESVETMIYRKAEELAKMLVQRTSHSMLLEDQEISYQRKEKAISERALDIAHNLPKALWD
ncbi:MAG: mobile mystery protein A [Sphingobacteriales bacterium]